MGLMRGGRILLRKCACEVRRTADLRVKVCELKSITNPLTTHPLTHSPNLPANRYSISHGEDDLLYLRVIGYVLVEGVNGGGVFVVFWVGDFAAPEDVVGQNVAADGGFGEDEVEIFLVVLLVGVDEHEVE